MDGDRLIDSDGNQIIDCLGNRRLVVDSGLPGHESDCAECCGPTPCWTLYSTPLCGGAGMKCTTTNLSAYVDKYVKILGSGACWLVSAGCSCPTEAVTVIEQFDSCEACLCCYCDALTKFGKMSSLDVYMKSWTCIFHSADCSGPLSEIEYPPWFTIQSGSLNWSSCTGTAVIWSGQLSEECYSTIDAACAGNFSDPLPSPPCGGTLNYWIKYDCSGVWSWSTGGGTWFPFSLDVWTASATGLVGKNLCVNPYGNNPEYSALRHNSESYVTLTNNGGCADAPPP